MPVPRPPLLGRLGRRLLAMFLVVALAAIGLVAVLAMRAVQTQTAGLAADQRTAAEHRIVRALGEAYATAGSWALADLRPARAIAQEAGLQVVVLSATGGQVATLAPAPSTTPGPEPTADPAESGTRAPSVTPPAPTAGGTGTPTGSGGPSSRGNPTATSPGRGGPRTTGSRAAAGGGAGEFAIVPVRNRTTAPVTAIRADDPDQALPIVVDGVTVGSALIAVAPQAPTPTQDAANAILRSLGGASLLAALLALLASVGVAHRIVRPVVALGAAARALQDGDPDPAAVLRPGPGELGDVAAAFARMASSLRRQDELRRTMAADVAHELRTPVTILKGTTEEMLDGLAPVTREAVDSLHDEILRLERLVDDLATLSAAEAAGLRLDREPVDLAEVVRHALAQLRPRFAEQDHRTAVTIAPGPLVVHGDEARLTQVMTNLLVNAIAFTPPGGRIDVEVAPRPGPEGQGDQVVLQVSDTGPGIPPEVLPRVFERFFRGSTTGNRRGTGIGLAVVAELVAAHEGQVSAASPPGRGAVVTVILPAG